MDPKLIEATLGSGICQLQIGRPEKALGAFEFCLMSKPGYDKALYGQAVALQLLGRDDDALQVM